MELNDLKTLLTQPKVIIGSLVTVAAIGGVSTAMLQPTPQATNQRETTTALNTSSTTTPTKPDRPNASAKPDSTDRSDSRSSDSTPTEQVEPSGDYHERPVKETEPPDSRELPVERNKVERCEITMAKVNDPNPPANVRSKPNTDSKVVDSLKNDTFVTVVDDNKDWLKISTPTKGWIAKNITLNGCNQKEERVSFAKGETMASIDDTFIGTGSHTYKMYLLKGQTLRVRSARGPRPTVINPQGKTLVETADEASTWSTKLNQSGDYQFVLDSNFKGYKYSFAVTVLP